MQRAERVVIIATGDKVGRRAFARICATSRIERLVTDTTAPEGQLAELRAAGVAVDVV